jgi:hypothetical protein
MIKRNSCVENLTSLKNGGYATKCGNAWSYLTRDGEAREGMTAQIMVESPPPPPKKKNMMLRLLLVLTWRPYNSIANSFGRTPQKETPEILENSDKKQSVSNIKPLLKCASEEKKLSEGNPVWRDKAVSVRKPWQENFRPS